MKIDFQIYYTILVAFQLRKRDIRLVGFKIAH